MQHLVHHLGKQLRTSDPTNAEVHMDYSDVGQCQGKEAVMDHENPRSSAPFQNRDSL